MSGECIHYLEVKATDLLENTNITNQTYYLDDTSPEITKEVGEPKYGGFVTTSTEIILSASDYGCNNGVGLDTLEYRIWNGSWSEWNTYTNPFSFGETCVHYLEVKAIDKLGNSYIDNETFYVDDTPPISSVDTISPYWHNESHIPFEITATASDDGCEGGSGVKEVALYYNYSADNSTNWTGWIFYASDTTASYNWSFTGSDGYYQFYSIAIDNVDNIEDTPTTADAIAGIDTTPPTIEVIYPKGREFLSGIITIKWNATDNVANLNRTILIKYSGNNGSTWNEIDRELNNTGEYDWDTMLVSDGSEYLIMVNATDYANNTGSNVSSSVFTIDNTLPETTYELFGTMGKNGWYISNVEVTLDVTDALSGINYTRYKIDMGPWKTYTSPFTVSTDGSHIVRYYSADNAGNREPTDSAIIKIDKTAPIIRIERPRGYLYIFDMKIIPFLFNKTMIIGSITIVVNATDATSRIERVEFFIDNKSKYNDTEYPYNWSWDETAFFKHSIKVVAYDKAGNKSTDEIEVVIFNIKN
jgi:hypothetical protein